MYLIIEQIDDLTNSHIFDSITFFLFVFILFLTSDILK